MSHAEGGGGKASKRKRPLIVFLCFPYGHPKGNASYFKSVME